MSWVVYDLTAEQVCREYSEKWRCDVHRRESENPRQFKVMSKDAVPKAALRAWKLDLADAEKQGDWTRLANHSIFKEQTYLEMLESELEECQGRVKTLRQRIRREQLKAVA